MSVQEAMSIPGWKTIMEEEKSALSQNDIGFLLLSLQGKILFRCRWVYVVKDLPDGSIETSEGSPGCKRVYPNIWYRLFRDILSCC
jgi:hypothetical protein